VCGLAVWPKIRVTVNLVLVELDQLVSFFGRKLAISYPAENLPPETVVQLYGVETDG
jgi:hypothetical protein